MIELGCSEKYAEYIFDKMGRAYMELGNRDSASIIFKQGLKYLHENESLLTVAAWNAGKLDAVVSINDKIFIVDFKTSKKIYKHYHLQVAAYAAAFRKSKSVNRMGYIEEMPVDGMILRLDKKTGKFQEKAFSLSNRNHFNIFKNCLEIKAWNSKRIMGVKHVN